MSAPGLPILLPKIASYIRLQFDPKEKIKPVVARLETPWGDTINVGEISADLISQAKNKAAEKNLPVCGIVLKAVMAPFPIQTTGLIQVIVRSGSAEHVCAVLRVELNPASVSPPPSEQSPPAAPAS